ncbi:hypothetical protein GALMADRAFT_212073 [Galerina marginata CBS 339.88]|uniref:Uncharacterized protein n=1 Tax=Galerina marginata (strain CBS 339.88) TaxID=685588 RepID=A0A067T6E8_GALM3|nr:hypothetical protein GALMADRAFT_212073 [Galerina marginata CBS 339.88]
MSGILVEQKKMVPMKKMISVSIREATSRRGNGVQNQEVGAIDIAIWVVTQLGPEAMPTERKIREPFDNDYLANHKSVKNLKLKKGDGEKLQLNIGVHSMSRN